MPGRIPFLSRRVAGVTLPGLAGVAERPGRLGLVGLVGLGLMMQVACGSRRDERVEPAPEDDRARPIATEAPLPPVTPLPLGKPALAEFTYNREPATAALERALQAEAAGDWRAAGAAAAEALAAVPGNLEAAWILALMRARQGELAGVLEPLSTAVAGDWLRWGERALRDPILAGFHASAHGARYRALAEIYDERFRQTLAEDLLLVGRRGTPRYPGRTGSFRVNHRSEIYAYDADSGRYVRASRTDGALVGYARAPAGKSLLYASYRRVHVPAQGTPALTEVRVGGMDLEQARVTGEVAFEDVARIEIGHRVKIAGRGAAPGTAPPELLPVARVQSARDGAWRTYALDLAAGVARPLEASTIAAPAPAPAPAGDGRKRAGDPAADAFLAAATLVVSPDAVYLDRLPVDGVMADWDDAGTAGAFRIERTRKTVTLAAGESVDGHSMVWSPTRARLAFATAAADRCAADPAARRVTLYAVDATTGALRPVAQGEGDFAPMWLDDTRLAYMQEPGPEPLASAPAGTALGAPVVTIVDAVTGAPLARLEGPAGVGTTHLPRRRCPPPSPASADPTVPPDAGVP
jgi:hypothetical protein